MDTVMTPISKEVDTSKQCDTCNHPMRQSSAMSDSKKKLECNKYFFEFTSNTSLHGLKYAGETHRSIAERVWWCIMVLLSFSTCVYLISKVWIKWDQNPVIVSFAETSTPMWQIPFPAVTVCPVMKVKESTYNYSRICENETLASEDELLSYDLYIISECYNRNCLLKDTKFTNETAIEKLYDISKTIDDILLGCVFNTENDCEKIFTPIITDEGVCFSANMLNPREIYREGIWDNKKYYLNHGKYSDGWTMETGYPKNSTASAYPERVKGSGLRAAFLMFLGNKKNDVNEKCISLFDGLKISLHAPDTLPAVSQNFFWAPYDVDTVTVIKPQMITTSEGLQNYKPERRQCFLPHEKRLKFFNFYNQANCELECLTNYTEAACGCVHFNMPHYESTPVCAIKSNSCVENVSDDYFKKDGLLKEHEDKNDPNVKKKLIAKENSQLCNCLPACTSISYETVTSQTNVKWDKYLQRYNMQNISANMNLAFVRLYFNDAQFITSKRSELYGITDFLANCGGLLGVCLGFSILSLVEVIYFFIIRVLCDMRHRLKSRKIKDVNDHFA